MIRKFKFTLATNMVGSGVTDIMEYNSEDYEWQTEDELEKIVSEDYEQWVWDNNYGGWTEVE